MTARKPRNEDQGELFPAPKTPQAHKAPERFTAPVQVERVKMTAGDTVRASWSEKVYMSTRTDVLVSTAIEMAAVDGESLQEVMSRLQRAMVSAHRKNIMNARGGK